jgi:hypothetical protein
MASEMISCPYCNAYVEVPEPLPPGNRLYCSRCGETFPHRDATIPAAPFEGSGGDGPVALAGVGIPRTRRWSNRWIGGVVAVIMSVMALVGLTMSLKTVPLRRMHDFKEPLGFIPGDSNLVAAVNVSQVTNAASGRDFLKWFGLGSGSQGFVHLEKWTGLSRENFEYVVAGVRIDDRLIPRVIVVVQTKVPYEETRLREAVKDAQQIQHKDKVLYRFPLDRGPFNGTLWCAGNTILVLSLNPEDMDDVPAIPRTGIGHLPAPIQAFLKEDLRSGTQAWIAATSPDWTKTMVWPLLPKLVGQSRDLLAHVDTLGAGLRFEDQVLVNAACRCDTQETAETLHEALERQVSNHGGTAKMQKDNWVAAETRTSADSLGQALQQAFQGFMTVTPK